MPSRPVIGVSRSPNKQIIPLCSAGSEYNLPALCLQGSGNPLSGLFQIGFRIHPLLVQGGGVPIVLPQDFDHEIHHLLICLRGGRIVQIYFHTSLYLLSHAIMTMVMAAMAAVSVLKIRLPREMTLILSFP